MGGWDAVGAITMATTQAELKEKVLDHLDNVFAGDFEAAAEDYVDDFTTTVTRPTGEEVELGVEEVQEDWKNLVEVYPDLSYEAQEMAAEDGWVFIRFEASGTHEGESRFWDIEPTGVEVEAEVYNSYRFEDGEIAEVHGVSDGVAILRQLGVDLPVKA